MDDPRLGSPTSGEDAVIRRLSTWADLLAATSGDPWVRLHADAWPSPAEAWALDDRNDEAVAWVSADPTDVGELRPVLHAVGRPLSVAALCGHLLAGLPEGREVTLPVAAEDLLAGHGLLLDVEVRWHYRALTAPPAGPLPAVGGWLAADDASRREVLAMLQEHTPELIGRADTGEAHRWAGLRDEATGELVVVCADVSPRTAAEGATTGVLGSIAVHRGRRRQGLGSLVIRWAAGAMFAEGRTSVGLAVYADNAAALAAYDRLGFDDRQFATGRARPAVI